MKKSYDIGELVREAERASAKVPFAQQYGHIDVARITRSAWLHGYEAGSRARAPKHGIKELKR